MASLGLALHYPLLTDSLATVQETFYMMFLNAGIEWLAHGLLAASWWQIVLYTLVTTHITIASVTIYLHRHQAHRAMDLHALPAHFFRFWLWLGTGQVTKE